MILYVKEILETSSGDDPHINLSDILVRHYFLIRFGIDFIGYSAWLWTSGIVNCRFWLRFCSGSTVPREIKLTDHNGGWWMGQYVNLSQRSGWLYPSMRFRSPRSRCCTLVDPKGIRNQGCKLDRADMHIETRLFFTFRSSLGLINWLIISLVSWLHHIY
jgi:hypothetical protein